jgi:dipeptidyl aminopeptidase/acylaminoacyl peptidase
MIKFLTLAVALFIYAPVFAQATKDTTEQWTPEDIIHTEYLQNIQFSPDKSMVVWTKNRGVEKKDKFVNDIYLTRLNLQKDGTSRNESGNYKTIRLTNSDESDHSPLFSRDGETIYFLSSRDDGKKLWSLSIYGGEAKEVHEFKDGIADLQWLSDSTLAFVSEEGKSLYEQELEEMEDNTVVVEDSLHWDIKRVYAFDIKNKKIERLSENAYPVEAYSISRDGRWMVTALTMSPHFGIDAHPKPTYYLYDLQNDTHRQILEGMQTPGNFQFTQDNQGFYFSSVLSSDPQWTGAGISELYYYDLAKNTTRKVDLDWSRGIGEGGFEVGGNDVLVALANGPTEIMALYYRNEADNWTKLLLDWGSKNEHFSVQGVSQAGDRVVFEHSTASQLPRYYVADLSLNAKTLRAGKILPAGDQELVVLNKDLKEKKTARSEVFHWKGYNEEEVSGILFYPKNYEAGKKYPLVLSIHGGPAGADLDLWEDRWSTYPQIFTQKGAFVLKPNYHGSSNYGQTFVESIKGHYYDLEMEDITKGITALSAKGLIDTAQMGVMGWSNGAILTTMLTVRYPDMFKVAAPGAGDVNWTSDYGTCEFGVQFDQSYFQGAPWDDQNGKTYNENYILKSPLFELEKVKTPTIIFHGSEDRAVPRDQGWEYYRALQQAGKTNVRFLWFPEQPHGLQKITHQLRKMNEEIAWFDKYLFNTHEPENEAFKEDSPLALLLKKEKAACHESKYGIWKNDKLLPEVVVIKKDSIAIGKFEVTHAQYQAFQSSHTFEAGKANYPITSISLKDAQGYVQWVSRQTGENYRLPNPKEARAFHDKVREDSSKENTLNYWAGYKITVDEIAMLQKKIKEANSSLIKEAGSFNPCTLGAAEVYDLGGNVAEYANDGTTYGYSAYDFADPNTGTVKAESAHIGFRVVKEL